MLVYIYLHTTNSMKVDVSKDSVVKAYKFHNEMKTMNNKEMLYSNVYKKFSKSKMKMYN